jgi:hypothetical protein
VWIYGVSSQSILSKQPFAHVQQRMLQSITTSHEFKQKRQHQIHVLKIDAVVLVHFIQPFEVGSLSITSDFTSTTTSSFFTTSSLDSEDIYIM